MGLPEALTTAEAWWSAHGYQLLIGAMVATAAVLAVTLYRARRRGRLDRWVSVVAGVAVLGLSAEGMWVVAVDRLHLPAVLAVVTFAVFELAMLSSAMHATAQYRRTTVRDETGAIVTPGHPGRHGTVVWAIAGTAGVIVSLNSSSFVEVLLRLALPILAAGMWWTTLTAEGTSRPEGTWRWTPRRLLVRVGAIEPSERDLADVTRDRRVHAMTVTARRVHRGSWPRRFHVARLERHALRADPDMLAAAQSRVERAHRARDLTAPGSEHTPTGHTDTGHMSPAAVLAPVALPGPATNGEGPHGLPVNGHTRTSHAPTGEPQAAASPAPRRSSSVPRPQRDRPGDDAILATHGSQLTAEYLTTGRLTEYRVRQVAGISARPSRRVRDRIITQANQDHHAPGQQHASEQTTSTSHDDQTDTESTIHDISEPDTVPFQNTRHEHDPATIHDTPRTDFDTILT